MWLQTHNTCLHVSELSAYGLFHMVGVRGGTLLHASYPSFGSCNAYLWLKWKRTELSLGRTQEGNVKAWSKAKMWSPDSQTPATSLGVPGVQHCGVSFMESQAEGLMHVQCFSCYLLRLGGFRKFIAHQLMSKPTYKRLHLVVVIDLYKQ